MYKDGYFKTEKKQGLQEKWHKLLKEQALPMASY